MSSAATRLHSASRVCDDMDACPPGWFQVALREPRGLQARVAKLDELDDPRLDLGIDPTAASSDLDGSWVLAPGDQLVGRSAPYSGQRKHLLKVQQPTNGGVRGNH